MRIDGTLQAGETVANSDVCYILLYCDLQKSVTPLDMVLRVEVDNRKIVLGSTI